MMQEFLNPSAARSGEFVRSHLLTDIKDEGLKLRVLEDPQLWSELKPQAFKLVGLHEGHPPPIVKNAQRLKVILGDQYDEAIMIAGATAYVDRLVREVSRIGGRAGLAFLNDRQLRGALKWRRLYKNESGPKPRGEMSEEALREVGFQHLSSWLWLQPDELRPFILFQLPKLAVPPVRDLRESYAQTFENVLDMLVEDIGAD